jgi:hypothetical protein
MQEPPAPGRDPRQDGQPSTGKEDFYPFEVGHIKTAKAHQNSRIILTFLQKSSVLCPNQGIYIVDDIVHLNLREIYYP